MHSVSVRYCRDRGRQNVDGSMSGDNKRGSRGGEGSSDRPIGGIGTPIIVAPAQVVPVNGKAPIGIVVFDPDAPNSSVTVTAGVMGIPNALYAKGQLNPPVQAVELDSAGRGVAWSMLEHQSGDRGSKLVVSVDYGTLSDKVEFLIQ